ncbi:MAG: branched-chain amino acid ABC transporter permease [Reyranella sp.]|uniref:branched-chain amino acid ABC transporter permease n=1 Tax=Reyranella sp. TaxID=1929291 RepID=UPI001AD0C647|nr:branched-chain amino acid ABC transporter permease [Reyranella sp.]MBN9087014.1 branched-chain amino acid ABC transporter permease [Reyranella sp.]
MTDLLQLLIAGLATGAIYALAAIGFTLLWQTSQTINFAQGEFVMVPAFFALIAMKLGIPYVAALVVAILMSMLLLGAAFRYAVVGPLLNRGVLPLVISTIALGIILKESVKDIYSAEAQVFPTLLPDRNVTLLPGVTISLAQIGVLVVALITIGGLQWFLAGTRTGRQMQATAQNPTVARILGVPVERMILYTFLINAGLAAMASILVSPIYLAKFSNGETLGLIAFVAAIVGGFNQVRGAIAGGLLVGVLDNLAAAYVSTAYRQAIPLILLVLVILFRPQGLLGRKEERAV